ncbi:NUDIX domain-containing protein [Alicyclobacillus mengziensis]|uniref:NUDIX domain-containing protein n=1 Tax=Alicyclobacillus mengziensis TaxID=2931921 RepID=A0A9X7W2V3_9BACL|nr:NUDIX domain-containing protein [Alicyclobacillus mengziensis]QSO49167.1 NUDIX domain-containing protein [Alicyclobacillus mengziensis]
MANNVPTESSDVSTASQTTDVRPFAVLVFPIFDGHVIWVRHPRRGWEVPGGKLEPGETPEDAAIREVFEESGAILENVEWVGEYHTSDGLLKFIYFADVVDVKTRPEWSETTDVMVPRPLWDPETARRLDEVSFIMKDQVYHRVWPLLLQRIEGTAGRT